MWVVVEVVGVVVVYAGADVSVVVARQDGVEELILALVPGRVSALGMVLEP